MVVVDTSVWIDLFAGRETPQVALLHGLARHERLAVGDLMLCEVLQGTRTAAQRRRVKETLLRLELVAMVGVPNALVAAGNYRALRQRGITVRGTIDCLIATFCIEAGLPLLHNDRDFDPFERHLGLQVVR
jgi:predicted nucleic acid-binding protein